MPAMVRTRPPARDVIKRVLVGRALATHKQEHQLLPKILALPVFSSDPLSSNAYATEEMMLVLVLAGSGALSLRLPIALAIAALLVVVVTSYRQTVRAYPRGGGSYIVARENLGTLPGLVAAAAILSDYVLTVAVSITAGTIAITSAVPALREHRVGMALALVGFVTLANLRGVKEAGTLFAIPTYGFVAMVGLTLATGFARCLSGCPVAETADLPLPPEGPLTWFLVLRAFASGATALTGVEAIADGVGAFRRPQARNAAATLAIMGAMSVTMFLGITWLAGALHVRTNHEIALHTSVLAQIGETVFGHGVPFALLQAATAGILVLAANTAYQDFPRLSSILARDRFMPAQFRNRGDRLVFSNGVIALATLAGLLIWIFDAELTRLIQLYVVGVFTAFTLSQAGMVRRWITRREPGWRRSAAINGVGAAVTGVVLVIVTLTKFTRGAWIVIAAMPVIVSFFLAVRRHYERTGRLLRARELRADVEARTSFLMLVPELGPSVADAAAYLLAVRPERVVPLYVGAPEAYEQVAAGWAALAPRLGRLERLAGAAEHPVRAVRAYLRRMPRGPDDFVTVVIPERVGRRSPFRPLGDRRALFLKTSLLFEPGVVVTNVPLLPEEEPLVAVRGDHVVEPRRSVVLVPVSAVHDATVRALVYAKALRPAVLEALYLVTDPEEVGPMVEEWRRRRIDVPLALVEAPFRDLGPPLLGEIRSHTRRGDTVVTVVLPEFVVHRWWEHVLHNQTAFYIKRLLLFEPRVVVTSVPYHLGAGVTAERVTP